MADQKITQLTEDTAPTQDDLIVSVNDPGGTPANRKVTLANLTAKQQPTSTVAGLSAAAWSGRLQWPSDGFYVYRDSGSANVPWGPIFPLTEPVSGDFAWINQGSATISTTNGGVYLEGPAEATAYNWHIRKKAAPATPYTITAGFLMNWDALLGGTSLNAFAGLLFRQSSDGKLHTFEIFAASASGGPHVVRSTKYTNATTISATYDTLASAPTIGAPLIWLRIADNGTNRICSISADGQNFIECHSVGRTDFLTADEVGFGITGYSSRTGMTLLSWKQA